MAGSTKSRVAEEGNWIVPRRQPVETREILVSD